MVCDLEIFDDGDAFWYIEFTTPAGHKANYYDSVDARGDRLRLFMFLKGFYEWLEKRPDLDDQPGNIYGMIVAYEDTLDEKE